MIFDVAEDSAVLPSCTGPGPICSSIWLKGNLRLQLMFIVTVDHGIAGFPNLGRLEVVEKFFLEGL